MNDLVVFELKETASFKADGVLPLENCCVAAFINTLLDANHLGSAKVGFQQFPDRISAPERLREDNLLIDGIFVIHHRQPINISGVE